MAQRFRLNKDKYESIFLTVCGLVRLRIGSLVIKQKKNKETGETIDILFSHIFSGKLSFA